MKKLLIALAILIIIILGSPAVIGSVAESAVQESLGWAAGQAGEGEVNVSAESFEKGWFSSTVRYRIKVGSGQLQMALLEATEMLDAEALPQLLVETKLDHGVLPLSTLKPGLGSAFSTITLELNDASYELPGTVFSNIGFGGQVDSVYVLEAGGTDVGDTRVDWEPARIELVTSPTSGRVMVDINSDGMLLTSSADNTEMTVGKIAVFSDQEPSAPGFYVGTTDIRFESLTASSGGVDLFSFGPMAVEGTSTADGELMDVDAKLSMDFADAPMVGDLNFVMNLGMTGFDGLALESLSETLAVVEDSLPPDAMYMLVEDDLMRIFEQGFEVNMSDFDFDMDLGRSDTSLQVTVPPMKPGFTWPEVLQAATAEATMTLPVALMDMAIAMNPQANAAIGMGLLKRNGDIYEMDAQYEKGLVTINGAPFPLPLPMPAEPGS
ncbi:MAG: DUF945 family protein [Pseudomonadota bacterium]